MNRGFTLVELLGTIVILTLIVVIAFPSMINQLRDSNKAIDESVVRVAEAAAREYVMNNIEIYPKANSGTTKNYDSITVDFLIENGYMAESFLDKYPEISDDVVKVSADEKRYIIEYEEVE